MGIAGVAESWVRKFDGIQQDRRLLAQPIGTVRKYADDRGSALAGLLTFQVFLGMLPLLVVALTVFGRILETNADLEEAVLDSTLVQFPVLGSRLQENITGLTVTGPWIWLTIGGLLWTAAGIYHSFQLALNQVWNVSGVDRQGFVSRYLRALVLFVLVFVAAIGSSLLRRFGIVGLPAGALVEAVAVVIGAAVAAALLLGVFRIVVAPVVPTSYLVPAAVFAGTAWEVLQRLGSWLVLDRLAEAQDLYGAIGFVVVTLSWINLLARSVIFANEFAVVQQRRLWPRSIAQPPLTAADREVLVGLLRNERRRPEEHVVVRFDPNDGEEHHLGLVHNVDPSTRRSIDEQPDTGSTARRSPSTR